MINTVLFESPYLLFVLLVAIQSGLVAIWWRRRTPPWTRTVCAGFAAIPTLLVLSHLVVTQRERVIGTCRELAAMVEAGEVTGIGRRLADDFEASGLNRSRLLDRIEQNFKRYRVENARLRGFEVSFPRKDQAVAVFNAVCRVRSAEMLIERLLSRWRLTFQSRGQSWKVTRIEALPTPMSPIRNLRDWLP